MSELAEPGAQMVKPLLFCHGSLDDSFGFVHVYIIVHDILHGKLDKFKHGRIFKHISRHLGCKCTGSSRKTRSKRSWRPRGDELINLSMVLCPLYPLVRTHHLLGSQRELARHWAPPAVQTDTRRAKTESPGARQTAAAEAAEAAAWPPTASARCSKRPWPSDTRRF